MSFSFESFEHDGLHTYLHTAYEDRREDQVYLDLIWRLTDGFKRYAIPRYYREAGVTGWGEPYALVAWEYEVEVEADREPMREAIHGFVPARSSVSYPVSTGPEGIVLGSPSPYAASNAKKAGLFTVFASDTLAKVVKELQCDATAQLNFFAMSDGPDRLVSALSNTVRPRLADVLGPTDLFVDFVIGVDMGYSSVLLIQSQSDLSTKLGSLVDG